MDVEAYFKNGKVYVWKETFVIVKSKTTSPDAFVNIVDKNETTVIIDQLQCNKNQFLQKNAIAIEKNWRMLTFAMVLPFELIGFVATVSTALAQEKIPIMVISAYSTDHLMVKKSNLTRAIKTLEKLGCTVEKK
ncbi:ACT domain-containing protein [Candidatus Woesearchaeota archaeon]|nr:ACT domain-containing protein [Candidatus Woesearchaeota archaeon]